MLWLSLSRPLVCTPPVFQGSTANSNKTAQPQERAVEFEWQVAAREETGNFLSCLLHQDAVRTMPSLGEETINLGEENLYAVSLFACLGWFDMVVACCWYGGVVPGARGTKEEGS